uniref:Uncharacterized protein n=1 Tax=Daucus carota subsp. sativus TaxID=79200 RepID=A0A161ZJB1_DAUCS
MSTRRIRLSSSSNPRNSTENTPVGSQQSERQHTPAQSQPNTPNVSTASANESANESADEGWVVGSMHNDGRLRIEVISGLLEPSGACSRAITDSISERQDPTGFNWKVVSKEVKDFYFEEFKNCEKMSHERVIVYFI